MRLIKGFFDGLRPEPRLLVSEWANQHRRLSSSASAEPGKWRTDRVPYLREIMDKLSNYDPCQEVVVMKGAQLGLALDISTPIPTIDGWKAMGEITKGDIVFDENGKPCEVKFSTDYMFNHECYKVTFSDGSEIVADKDHKWEVWDEKKYEYRKKIILNTETIFDTFKCRGGKRNRYAIDVCGSLETEEKKFIVPPYTLGAWLGDGNSCSNRITTHVGDAEEMASYISKEGVYCEIFSSHSKGNCTEIVMNKPFSYCQRGHDLSGNDKTKNGKCAKCHRRRSNGDYAGDVIFEKFGVLLNKIGVFKNKHIPIEYLRASKNQRLALLQGLMDTDGHIRKDGFCEFYSCDKKLCDGVFELIVSLGLKPLIRFRANSKPMSIDGIRFYDTNGLYVITYHCIDVPVFKLARKLSRVKRKGNLRISEIQRRRIVDVVKTESVPVKCIEVNSDSHLYLAGRNMIPTHNTEAGNNWIGYVIDISPSPMLMVMPTEPTVKRNSKIRIDPMISDTPRLSEKIRSARERDSKNTVLMKSFPGGNLIMAGAQSAAGLRSMPVSKLFLDEIDGYPSDLDGEGSPIDLATARTRTFANRKIYKISTPTVEGVSVIEKEFRATDQRYYFVPCPECSALQILTFPRLKVKARGADGKPTLTVYICQHCKAEIEERHKTIMLKAGSWTATVSANSTERKVGYHISSIYSPLGWFSWNDIMLAYEDAVSDPVKMKTFVNTILGETYKEIGEVPDWNLLYERREAYSYGQIPDEVAFLTGGVDVQLDRIEMSVYGWYEGKRRYLIEHFVFMGRTDRPEVWDALETAINFTFIRSNGAEMSILLTCIDTGYNTSYVYDFCRRFDQTKVVPVKGRAQQDTIITPPRQIDIDLGGKKIGTIGLYNIGVSVMKSELYGILKLEIKDGIIPKGWIHFPVSCDEHFFKGITAEQLQFKIDSRGFKKYEWFRKYLANEPLDCSNYARAAASIAGIDRMSDVNYQIEREKYEKQVIEVKKDKIVKRRTSW